MINRTAITTFSAVIIMIGLVSGDPKPTEKMERGKPISIEQTFRRAETNKCYRVIILPMVLDGRSGPSGRIEAGAPDYAVIEQGEIAKFFELLKKRKPCDGLELGFQYDLTFLMEDAPTSPIMNLMFRRVGQVWYLANLEEAFEMDEEFSRWLNERMVKIEVLHRF